MLGEEHFYCKISGVCRDIVYFFGRAPAEADGVRLSIPSPRLRRGALHFNPSRLPYSRMNVALILGLV